MENFTKRIMFTVLGVVVMLGYWTVKGWITGDASATVAHIPAKVWDGGGAKVTIEAESTDPARISASFETNTPVDSADHKMMETWERVPSGVHTYTIDVPAGVGGMVEVDAENPKPGSKVRVTVKVDGRTVAEDSEVLNEPLKSGYAFFAQVSLEDYATGKLSND